QGLLRSFGAVRTAIRDDRRRRADHAGHRERGAARPPRSGQSGSRQAGCRGACARRQIGRRGRAARQVSQKVICGRLPPRRSDALRVRMAKTRSETDSFGPIDVPADRYWGAQTERSLENFRIGTERMPRVLIHALGIVKRAAAETNVELKSLDKRRGSAIVKAAQEVIDAKLDDH